MSIRVFWLLGQLRGQLHPVVKRANRHELRLLYADFLLRPAAGGEGGGGGGGGGGEGGGREWESLRSLCLDKYREQIEKVVASDGVRTSAASRRFATDEQP